MNAFAVLVFSSVLVATLAIDCAVEPDGNYEIGCRSYAQCVGSVLKIIDCDMGMVYNNKTGSCADPKDVAPPCGHAENCQSKKDGKYADITQNCHSYYTCNKETFLGHNICPGGLVFDEALETCNWKENVPPPCGTKQ